MFLQTNHLMRSKHKRTKEDLTNPNNTAGQERPPAARSAAAGPLTWDDGLQVDKGVRQLALGKHLLTTDRPGSKGILRAELQQQAEL